MNNTMSVYQPDSVIYIRESSRNLLKLSRRSHRDEDTDSRRSLPSTSATTETVSEIANKLKTKSSVSAEELRLLKNALLADPKHIDTVLSTHGALRGLARELSGQDIQKRNEAAGCCCNLALCGERSGRAVAKAAGPYLVPALDTLSEHYTITCTWALGNLAGSGAVVCRLLTAQGALGKLIDVVASARSEEVLDAALYAMPQFVLQLLPTELRTDHLRSLLRAISKIGQKTSTYHLLFLLSCHPDFTKTEEVNQEFLQNLLTGLPVAIEKHLTCPKSEVCCDLVYLVRTLANICIEGIVCDVVLNHFAQNNIALGFKMVLNVGPGERLLTSVMWLMGNLLNLSNDRSGKDKFIHDLINS